MEIYKKWQIEYDDFGYYDAINLNDCDADMRCAKSVDELKAEIDEEIE